MLPLMLLLSGAALVAAQGSSTPARPGEGERSQSSRGAAVAPDGPDNAAGPVSDSLRRRLQSPYQAAINDQPLRALLERVATAANFNLWLDRHIDPDQAVRLDAASRTVFETIAEVAEAVEAEAIALGNFVLVGQSDRIGALIGVILGEGQPLLRPAAGEVRWNAGTTPAEALAIAAGMPPDAADTLVSRADLPHDLWPAVHWHDVSSPLAVLLVTAQCDLMPAPGFGQRRPTLQPLRSPASISCSYPAGTSSETIRAIAGEVDAQSRLRSLGPGGGTRLDASPAAHQAVIRRLLRPASAASSPRLDPDRTRFTLKLRDIPAASVLQQLAAAAGRTLEVHPEAAASTQQRVTLELQDQSLRSLVDAVTQQIGLRAKWGNTRLQISTP